MSKHPRVLVLRTAGTNCNEETAFAFARFGADVEQVHVHALVKGTTKLKDYHILALPGGFSYGDDIASGRILANELRLKLGDDIRRFIADGKLVIGICNGFQVLAKAGILPGLGSNRPQEATLFNNDSAKFEARWTHLAVGGKSVWTKGLPSRIYLPVAHGEGKFIPADEDVLQLLKRNDQVVFRYCRPDAGKPFGRVYPEQGRGAQGKPVYPENPNGSVDDIAGICDTTGRVLGLMPHPERHFLATQHPSWTRLNKTGEFGDGAKIFANGVNYVKRNLLT